MASQINVLSSMATKHVVAELARLYEAQAGVHVVVESTGGVEALRRVRADEAIDVVILASDVIDELSAEGKLLAGSRVDLVRSGVAIAVAAGAPKIDISSEASVKQAILDARSVGYSTGPSGVYLQKLFQRWGIAETIADRIVQAKPGVPVGQLIVDGDVALGFQQLSELIHLAGIDILGPLPEPLQIVTIFSSGVGAASAHPEVARAFMRFMASDAATPAKEINGLQPAR